MKSVGFIGGSLFHESKKTGLRSIKTKFGTAELSSRDNFYFVQRHTSARLAPHCINHRANLVALKKMGVEEVIGISSVGSLRKLIRPGSIVIPRDYIDLYSKASIFTRRVNHITPEFDKDLRNKIIRTAKRIGLSSVNGGVYFQTIGPRLETKAEVAMISRFAEVVGMTMGTEATIAKELGMKYAGICSVDNYANGIVSKPLKMENITKKQEANLENIILLMMEVLK